MTLYNELGVEPDASPDEIKKGYRRAAQASHPDKNDGDDELFHRVAIAHDVLSDPDRRARYDATGDFSDQPKPRDATEGKLVELFAAIIADGSDKKGDVVHMCRQRIAHVLNQLNSSILKSQARVAHLERQLGRVTTTGDFNLYEQILTDELKHASVGLANMNVEYDIIKAAGGLLNSYEDTNPAEDQQQWVTMR